jgi:hypothetical protein
MGERRQFTSPKKLQKSGEYQDALRQYVLLYKEALTDKDPILSSYCLDEMVQTVILLTSGEATKLTIIEKINRIADETLDEDERETLSVQLTATMKKWFGKKISEEENLSLDPEIHGSLPNLGD